MSTWQIGAILVTTLYGSVLSYVVVATVRGLLAGEKTGPVRQFCPPHVNCQLCRGAEERADVRSERMVGPG